jgi:dihydroxy-acid dehydratase
MAGHVAPEAAMGGPIAAVREGDPITFDLPTRRLDLGLSDEEMHTRLRAWERPAPKYTQGVFARYIAQVGPAARGAVIDAGLAPSQAAAAVR